jgi:hypothetical protein
MKFEKRTWMQLQIGLQIFNFIAQSNDQEAHATHHTFIQEKKIVRQQLKMHYMYVFIIFSYKGPSQQVHNVD